MLSSVTFCLESQSWDVHTVLAVLGGIWGWLLCGCRGGTSHPTSEPRVLDWSRGHAPGPRRTEGRTSPAGMTEPILGEVLVLTAPGFPLLLAANKWLWLW